MGIAAFQPEDMTGTAVYFASEDARYVTGQLIVIDGGKGQLSAALAELQDLDIDIPIISLAKREEEVFLPRRRESVRLPLDSLGLKLLQRMRDEAHRFAIAYHRTLRAKRTLGKSKK